MLFFCFQQNVHYKQPHKLLCMLYFTELSPAETWLELTMIYDAYLQVELFSEAVAGKAMNAGWQSLTKDELPEPDANQLFAMPGWNPSSVLSW